MDFRSSFTRWAKLLHKVVTTVSTSSLTKKKGLKPIKRSSLESHWHFAVCRLSKPSGKISFPAIHMQCMVPQSLEQHFQALFTREPWTKAGKSVRCNALNELVPTCRSQFRRENRHVQIPDKSAPFILRLKCTNVLQMMLLHYYNTVYYMYPSLY